MFFKKKDSSTKKSQNNLLIHAESELFIQEIQQRLVRNADLKVKKLATDISIVYLETLIEKTSLHNDVISPLKTKLTPDEILEKIPIGEAVTQTAYNDVIESILKGSAVIHSNGYPAVISANIATNISRSLSKPENESQVMGPQLAFTESISTNISLIRRYIVNSHLRNETFELGKQTKTNVSLVYIEGIADEEMVRTLRQRVSDIKVDSILDSTMLSQLIEDNSLSIVPQMVLTERPDRTCAWLLNGKLIVLVDGSVQAIGCPQSFIEFFQSMEDQNVRWYISTFLRVLRMIAMILSVFFTAVYVASLTFHYEIIPQALLVPLSESRSRVPFPPIIEALLLEFIIELLREAGARLPTKVGQTMGIVGGIVIGTAAVDAGFTSNILIIIVALGALASFTTPSYMMGNVIRILRFPLIILAGFWGFYGLMFGFCFLLIHLLKQTSLGSPFLAPFYPVRLRDWRDSILRLPLAFTYYRPYQARPKNEIKYDSEKKDE